jgi:Phosphoribosylpyrophosphate synthetase
LKEIIFTDSIPYKGSCSKVRVLSVADLFADTIKKIFNNESISSQYLL